jgi:hypothetical protein
MRGDRHARRRGGHGRGLVTPLQVTSIRLFTFLCVIFHRRGFNLGSWSFGFADWGWWREPPTRAITKARSARG